MTWASEKAVFSLSFHKGSLSEENFHPFDLILFLKHMSSSSHYCLSVNSASNMLHSSFFCGLQSGNLRRERKNSSEVSTRETEHFIYSHCFVSMKVKASLCWPCQLDHRSLTRSLEERFKRLEIKKIEQLNFGCLAKAIKLLSLLRNQHLRLESLLRD